MGSLDLEKGPQEEFHGTQEPAGPGQVPLPQDLAPVVFLPKEQFQAQAPFALHLFLGEAGLRLG